MTFSMKKTRKELFVALSRRFEVKRAHFVRRQNCIVSHISSAPRRGARARLSRLPRYQILQLLFNDKNNAHLADGNVKKCRRAPNLCFTFLHSQFSTLFPFVSERQFKSRDGQPGRFVAVRRFKRFFATRSCAKKARDCEFSLSLTSTRARAPNFRSTALGVSGGLVQMCVLLPASLSPRERARALAATTRVGCCCCTQAASRARANTRAAVHRCAQRRQKILQASARRKGFCSKALSRKAIEMGADSI